MPTRLDDGLPPLPTLFRPEALREGQDALARAVAEAPRAGAGALFWVRSLARVEAAVVLEPEQPLSAARPVLLAGAAALADAFAALGPAELPVEIRWPATLLVNAGEVGRLRLVSPEGAAEDAVPEWLVLGLECRYAVLRGVEPGEMPERTTLEGEGFDVPPAEIVAAWARHLMAVLSDWQERGHRRLAERVLPRLLREPWMGEARRGLDPVTFDLVLEEGGTRRTVPLKDSA
ncbi:MAG: biotin/lipoate--protein ligase family protein [Acetobacteraceae bacterium]|nr:biotin/lipoate--protein ligase family protein [Acetobacteraceae bacterium]MDW8397216.1 biotin/lipoate--protein ligase family protein [Acetobacteraceae bacterium]